MGMFDYLECAANLPGNLPISGRQFHTRSLYGVMARFTITAEGRLLFHSFRCEHPAAPGRGPFMIPAPIGDIDLEFHGDIKLTADEEDLHEYVVRFTHGTLEWVRPFTDLSEPEQMLATRRSLED
jgi:hypothetical protein